MELGEKLRQARIEAGLSQRQLCADTITRNMLSQIEHGTARPSMDTLRYLAGRLGKPISYFLEEDAALSPNQDMMARARAHYQAGEFQDVWLLLQSFQRPDPLLEWEWNYLSEVTALELARQAMADRKELYARQLLEEAGKNEEAVPELRRQRLLLLGQLSHEDLPCVLKQLPSLDEELILRAKSALEEQQAERAAHLLLAAENQETPEWNLLRGRGLLQMEQYLQAVPYLEKAESGFPEVCASLLETCFRKLGDFRKAYFYACKQR